MEEEEVCLYLYQHHSFSLTTSMPYVPARKAKQASDFHSQLQGKGWSSIAMVLLLNPESAFTTPERQHD